jgi:hypothetical protein
MHHLLWERVRRLKRTIHFRTASELQLTAFRLRVRLFFGFSPGGFMNFFPAFLISERVCAFRFCFLLLICALHATAMVAHAAPGDEIRKFANPNPVIQDYYGDSIAASGSYVVIGNYRDSAAAQESGEFYVFDGPSGAVLHRIKNPTPSARDEFGAALSITGDDIYVSARLDDAGGNDNGIVYGYSALTGARTRTFLNPTSASNDWFGQSSTILNDLLVVGAPGNDTDGVDRSGAVYMFNRSTGDLLQTILNPSPAMEDHFGLAVAPLGTNLIVGAVGEDRGDFRSGAAYLFNGLTGQLLQTFENPAPEKNGNMGIAVAGTTENLVAVGAASDDTRARDAGAVYVFDALTGRHVSTLFDPTPFDNEAFGHTVTAVGRHVVVGNYFDDRAYVSFGGSVDIFDPVSGQLLAVFRPAGSGPRGTIGFAVAGYGNDILAGAAANDDLAPAAGTVFLFEGLHPDLQTIAYSAFEEPALGSGDYVHTNGAKELGFHTARTSSGGQSPLVAVNWPSDLTGRVLRHQSSNATTQFDTIDLLAWDDVVVSIDLTVANTGYEAGDFIRAYVTDGTEEINLLNLVGTSANDAIEQLAATLPLPQTFNVAIPEHWTSATLFITSSSNSSAAAERFDLDNVHFRAIPAVPEPSSFMLMAMGLFCFAAFIGAKRRELSVPENVARTANGGLRQ